MSNPFGSMFTPILSNGAPITDTGYTSEGDAENDYDSQDDEEHESEDYASDEQDDDADEDDEEASNGNSNFVNPNVFSQQTYVQNQVNGNLQREIANGNPNLGSAFSTGQSTFTANNVQPTFNILSSNSQQVPPFGGQATPFQQTQQFQSNNFQPNNFQPNNFQQQPQTTLNITYPSQPLVPKSENAGNTNLTSNINSQTPRILQNSVSGMPSRIEALKNNPVTSLLSSLSTMGMKGSNINVNNRSDVFAKKEWQEKPIPSIGQPFSTLTQNNGSFNILQQSQQQNNMQPQFNIVPQQNNMQPQFNIAPQQNTMFTPTNNMQQQNTMFTPTNNMQPQNRMFSPQQNTMQQPQQTMQQPQQTMQQPQFNIASPQQQTQQTMFTPQQQTQQTMFTPQQQTQQTMFTPQQQTQNTMQNPVSNLSNIFSPQPKTNKNNVQAQQTTMFQPQQQTTMFQPQQQTQTTMFQPQQQRTQQLQAPVFSLTPTNTYSMSGSPNKQ
jgi:hypothetical protein